MRLVLASASPRRQAMLREAGLGFAVRPADVDESRQPGESPRALAARLARAKAAAVAALEPGAMVLGADTIVVLGDTVLGKPGSLAEAQAMLRSLSGVTHEVLTGVALVRVHPAHEDVWVCSTRVTFRPLADEVIERYTALVNTLDKAGAYGIQEHGELLAARVDGRFSNVVGLPVEEVLERLAGLADRAPVPGSAPA